MSVVRVLTFSGNSCIGTAFLPCESSCALLESQTGWSFFRKFHKSMAFRQCEFDNVVTNWCVGRILFHIFGIWVRSEAEVSWKRSYKMIIFSIKNFSISNPSLYLPDIPIQSTRINWRIRDDVGGIGRHRHRKGRLRKEGRKRQRMIEEREGRGTHLICW